MKVYMVTMYRYGDKESHSYPLGVWSDPEIAKMNGNTEVLWRGRKYYFEIVGYELDTPNDLDTIAEVIYTLEDCVANSDKDIE